MPPGGPEEMDTGDLELSTGVPSLMPSERCLGFLDQVFRVGRGPGTRA